MEEWTGCHILSFIIKNLKKYLNNKFHCVPKTSNSDDTCIVLSHLEQKEDPDPGKNLTEQIGNPSLQMMPNTHQDRGEGGCIPAFPFRVQP